VKDPGEKTASRTDGNIDPATEMEIKNWGEPNG
jgi:hypothetical protein